MCRRANAAPVAPDVRSGSGKTLPYDVVVVGPIRDYDVVIAETPSYEGLACVVLRHKRDGLPDLAMLPDKIRNFSPDRILSFANSLDFYRLCQKAKCVITNTGVMTSYLGYLWFPLPLLPFPPIINVSTGSDIIELAVEKSLQGFRYRQLLRRVAFTIVPSYTQAIQAINKSRPQNIAFFKYPYLFPERMGGNRPLGDEIVYVHVSKFDWAATDTKADRNSTKGYDRFIRAFAAAAKTGAP